MNWLSFFEPYELALQELKINLRGIRQQYKTKGLHSPIEFVDGRVKTISSTLDKLEKMGLSIYEIDKVYDIAGIRINCQFIEDIYVVVELLKKRQDLDIFECRDYIINQRDSGYRSYHIHAYYHLETIDGMKKVMVEFQIRTLAMNFWASIEHSLNYKYQGQIPENIIERLRQSAEAAALLDRQMSSIRDEIAEAQKTFEKRQKDDHRIIDTPPSFTEINENYLMKKAQQKGD
ncbi:MAG TPA: GTP pyrophosphokinase [Firmicutes bacterium]|nr:GTP pyrophosphokinase [Bacillota bacterium]